MKDLIILPALNFTFSQKQTVARSKNHSVVEGKIAASNI